MAVIIFLCNVVLCAAQTARDFMIGANLDLIKSDNDGYFEKVQAGVEFNYFISSKFTATAGGEIWTRDKNSFVVGGRWYPAQDAFIRVRGLVGENDISIGGGWAKPFSEHWRVEAIADFYFEGYYSIRTGLAYLVRKKK